MELKRNEKAYVFAMICLIEKGLNEAVVNHLVGLEKNIEKLSK
jgi:hypothetical protein